jgi:protein-tyrosine phosphatase
MKDTTLKILFVCMGNICRSPAAETVMQTKIDEAELTHLIQCDSAGTIGLHSGQPADRRMRDIASQRGYHIQGKARQIQAKDLQSFNYILTMDRDNLEDVMGLDRQGYYRERIQPFCNYVRRYRDDAVPDPYYGGLKGFDHVLDILEDGCSHFLEQITP